MPRINSSNSDTGEHTGEHRSRYLDQFGAVSSSASGPSLHVVLREDLWIVRSAHSERAIAAFVTQDQAVARARRIAAQAGTDIVIHGEDGRIRDTVSVRKLHGAPHYHVTRRDQGWLVASDPLSGSLGGPLGELRPVTQPGGRVFGTKLEAVDAARDMARSHQGVLYIHASDGTIEQVYHYG